MKEFATKTIVITCLVAFYSCSETNESPTPSSKINIDKAHPSLIVLGTTQDAGSPQVGCNKACCASLLANPDPSRMVVSLGLVDHETNSQYLFEATPDLPRQEALLSSISGLNTINGIFLTHAHIGHYAGLMYLGKESMDAKSIPTYVMPRMQSFIKNNGPWDHLVERENIKLMPINDRKSIKLSPSISVTPYAVPHRDEYSETVGYEIKGPKKSALFIPDIDKWSKWDIDIVEMVKSVDYALIDATFYNGEELNNRDMSQIPHPFVVESMALFDTLSSIEKEKIIFIHLNHTNPLLDPNSKAYEKTINAGYRIAHTGDILEL